MSEGHHHKGNIDNESYELLNVDMKGGIVRGCGPPFEKTSEGLIGELPHQEQGEAEAARGNVAGVQLNHKVGAPWEEATDQAMPHQFVGVFQELA